MFAPCIILRASFSIAEIEVRICPQEWTAPLEYEALVRLEWEKMLAHARHPLWDGTYYRVLESALLKDRKLRLGTIQYRHIATLRALWEHHAMWRLEPLQHLSTTTLPRTADGYYLFGKRLRDNSIDLIGGGVQSDEGMVSSGTDIEKNLYKEIREEVGIGSGDIAKLEGIGIVCSETSNVLIVGHAQLDLSKADVEELFTDRTEDEMTQPVFIPEGELSAFMRTMADYRSLVADLL